MAFNAGNVTLGPGEIYVAPIGTTEPTTAEEALAVTFRHVGYTDAGHTFNHQVTVENVEVAEEFYPVRKATTGIDASVSFAMAEVTYKNLATALNIGADPTVAADNKLEPPLAGDEVRIMVLCDEDSGARWIFRQCIQQGNTEIARQKAPNKSTIAVEFGLEKPPGAVRPFVMIANATTKAA